MDYGPALTILLGVHVSTEHLTNSTSISFYQLGSS
ncbi:hypothetical protein B4U80_05972 [Leptotrombidium deliense]|uniref:Uncharacterized protein n=1 Tax=Leptotrombidium deliense TaxID=299467 RepID=A0A443S9X1_9ACAR|nr:hypothetical protein B4U80_05972 [Leptotrombidium deliense]